MFEQHREFSIVPKGITVKKGTVARSAAAHSRRQYTYSSSTPQAPWDPGSVAFVC
jgi:hypothetical protein